MNVMKEGDINMRAKCIPILEIKDTDPKEEVLPYYLDILVYGKLSVARMLLKVIRTEKIGRIKRKGKMVNVFLIVLDQEKAFVLLTRKDHLTFIRKRKWKYVRKIIPYKSYKIYVSTEMTVSWEDSVKGIKPSKDTEIWVEWS